jgi:FMN phosphatase YigB (HAD superfamily)
MTTTFGLFDTLVRAEFPESPAAAVGDELAERGVDLPDDWTAAYRETHIDPPEGAEVPLPAHVSAALSSRGVDAPGNAPRRAVVAAFDPGVETRDGAVEAVEAAATRGPVGLLANAAAPELLRRTLIRAAFDRDAFDAVRSSAACGWRKPDRRAFETLAHALDVPADELVHVGHPDAGDEGVRRVGGRFVDVTRTDLADLARQWRL